MYEVVCVQLVYFGIGDRKDISIAHVIIIKSAVSNFPIAMISFRGCVPEMFVTSYSITYYIYIPGKRGVCFHYYVQFMMSANIRMRFGLQIVLVCLCITSSHYHHFASISEDIELINACQIYFVECVNKIKHIISFIHYSIFRAVCFQFTPIIIHCLG